MPANGTRHGAAGEWSILDTCVRVDPLFPETFFEATIRVRVSRGVKGAPTVLASMIVDAAEEVIKRWGKLQ